MRSRNSRPRSTASCTRTGSSSQRAAETATNGTINTTFSAPDLAFDYLADGETVDITYTIKLNYNAGGITTQHNRKLRIKAAIKAGGISTQHNRKLRIKTAIKAGGMSMQHNRKLRIRTAIKAGGISQQHNRVVR